MKVLIVVDMIKAFALRGLEEGSLFFDDAEKIVPFVVNKVNEYLEKGWHIIFLCDWHAKDDKEFERFPKHAVINTVAAELIDELKHALAAENVVLIPKTRFSGFYHTDLNQYIEAQYLKDATFEFVGVCTGICVSDTITDLANRDMKTAVYRKGVADLPAIAYLGADSVDIEGGDTFPTVLEDIWLNRMKFLYGTKIL